MSVINCALCQTPVDTDFHETYEACEGCAIQGDEDREELAELRKDKARIDWIGGIVDAMGTYELRGGGWFFDISNENRHPSFNIHDLREAIDAAMSYKLKGDAE